MRNTLMHQDYTYPTLQYNSPFHTKTYSLLSNNEAKW